MQARVRMRDPARVRTLVRAHPRRFSQYAPRDGPRDLAPSAPVVRECEAPRRLAASPPASPPLPPLWPPLEARLAVRTHERSAKAEMTISEPISSSTPIESANEPPPSRFTPNRFTPNRFTPSLGRRALPPFAVDGGAPPRSGAARGHAPRLARALERPRRPPRRPPGGCGAGGRGGRWCERRWSGRGGCSGRRGRPRRLGRPGGAGGRPRARDGRARGFSRRGATRRGRGGGWAGRPGPGPPSERPPATLGGLGSLQAGAAPAPRGAAGIGLSRPRAQGPVPDLAARAAGPLPGAARKSCTARSSEWLSGQRSLDTPSCEWRAPAGVAGGGRGR